MWRIGAVAANQMSAPQQVIGGRVGTSRGGPHVQQRKLASAPRQRASLPPEASTSTSTSSSLRQQEPQQQPSSLACTRRAALPALGLVLLGAAASSPAPAARAAEQPTEAAASSSAAAATDFTTYSSPQGYSLDRPVSWEQVGKMGADVLFRDPEKKSTSVGVTVYPVTISSLEEFGDLEAVGKRLLDAERAKESTLGVAMLAQQQRRSAGDGSGVSIYDFEYSLNSTRGAKKIYNSVAVAGRKLFILNGALSCGKGEGAVCDAAAAELLQQVARTFTVSQ